jgi:hypothetical protein
LVPRRVGVHVGARNLWWLTRCFAVPEYPAYLRQKQRADERTRTADLLITSDNSCVAGVCTRLQFPHTQADFLSPACCVLHRIAFPVVSEWCQYHPRTGLGLRSSFASSLVPPVEAHPQLHPGARPRSGARMDAQAAVTQLGLLPHGSQVHYSRPSAALPRLAQACSHVCAWHRNMLVRSRLS